MTDSDDDFCMQMYDWAETRQTQRMQEVAEAEERWWIVMHDKVAVRPAPSTEGRPLAVLPRGAVVKVSGIKTVEGNRRWLTVHNDDLGYFRPKKKDGSKEAALAALGSGGPSAAYMLIEGATAGLGRLMMVAPKDFEWDNVAGIVPRRRGEVAQSQMVGGMPSEITDDYIEQLLEEGDEKAVASTKPTAAGNSLPPSSGGTVGFTEDEDGLVDVDLSRKNPAAVAMAAAAGLGGRTAYVRAKDGTAQLVSKFDQIMSAQAQVARGEKEHATAAEHAKVRAEREEKERKLFSSQARAKSATDTDTVPIPSAAVDPWAPYRDNPPGWPENPSASDGLPKPNFESFNDVGMMQLLGHWPADRALPKGPAYIPPTDGSPAHPRFDRFR